MSASKASEGSAETAGETRTFTSAERIAELNNIDKSVAALLKSAGSAIQILANTPTSSAGPTSLESQKSAFTKYSSDYFTTLSSIEVRLKRQVYALEEAGLTTFGDDKDAKRGRRIGGDENMVTGGGPLDTSWLNARAKDNVGRGMEREIWAQARALAQKYQSQGILSPGGAKIDGEGSKIQAMDVDKPDG